MGRMGELGRGLRRDLLVTGFHFIDHSSESSPERMP